MDEITRTGFIHNHNVAINAGSEKFKFYASFNYYDQNSILKISDLQRFSGRFNFEANFNKYVTLNVASMYSHLSSNNPSSGHTRMNRNEAVQTNAAIFFPSNMPLYDEEGKLTTSISPLTPNPATWFHIKNQTVTKRLMFSPNLEVKFLPWLKANVQLSVDKTDENREIFGSTKGKLPAQVEDNYGGFSNAFNDNYGIEEYLTFDKDIANGHHLNAVVGTGYYVTTSRSHNVMGYNFPTDVYENNNIGSTSDLERTNLGSWKTWRNKLSFFGRLNYTFKNRYILGVTLRNDGSSVFADNHKWGWFPGASAAWIISEEKFMKDFDVLSFLKLRAGYGTSGNESILTGGTYPLTTHGNAERRQVADVYTGSQCSGCRLRLDGVIPLLGIGVCQESVVPARFHGSVSEIHRHLHVRSNVVQLYLYYLMQHGILTDRYAGCLCLYFLFRSLASRQKNQQKADAQIHFLVMAHI